MIFVIAAILIILALLFGVKNMRNIVATIVVSVLAVFSFVLTVGMAAGLSSELSAGLSTEALVGIFVAGGFLFMIVSIARGSSDGTRKEIR